MYAKQHANWYGEPNFWEPDIFLKTGLHHWGEKGPSPRPAVLQLFKRVFIVSRELIVTHDTNTPFDSISIMLGKRTKLAALVYLTQFPLLNKHISVPLGNELEKGGWMGGRWSGFCPSHLTCHMSSYYFTNFCERRWEKLYFHN